MVNKDLHNSSFCRTSVLNETVTKLIQEAQLSQRGCARCVSLKMLLPLKVSEGHLKLYR